jgi:hypothetical protein
VHICIYVPIGENTLALKNRGGKNDSERRRNINSRYARGGGFAFACIAILSSLHLILFSIVSPLYLLLRTVQFSKACLCD